MHGMKLHLKSMAAVIGLKPNRTDGEFKASSVLTTSLNFVWLLAVRAQTLQDFDKPKNAVMLELLPEVARACEHHHTHIL